MTVYRAYIYLLYISLRMPFMLNGPMEACAASTIILSKQPLLNAVRYAHYDPSQLSLNKNWKLSILFPTARLPGDKQQWKRRVRGLHQPHLHRQPRVHRLQAAAEDEEDGRATSGRAHPESCHLSAGRVWREAEELHGQGRQPRWSVLTQFLF